MAKASLESAEFRIFRLALLNNPEDRENLVKEISSGSFDWSKVLEGARHHRLEHPLLRGLKGLEGLPDDFIGELREAAREASRNSLMQMREIARLAEALREADVPFLALKGVALAVQLGNDPTHRNSRDLDFLIRDDCLLRADAAMREAGYDAQGPDIRTVAPSYLRWNKEVKYFHPKNRCLVELHYRLVDNDALLRCEFDELWQQREIVRIAEFDVAVISRRYLPLYLSVHGATHGWERLCWLADLAAALPSPDAVSAAMEFAVAKDATTSLWHGILLAHQWLGCSVSKKQLAIVRGSRKIKLLNSVIARSYGAMTWFSDQRRGSLSGFLYYSVWLRRYTYSLNPGWKYRRRQFARELIAPADWDTFRLPQYFSWAYPLLRPVGWIVRRLTRTA
jgi:hypothetical protein